MSCKEKGDKPLTSLQKEFVGKCFERSNGSVYKVVGVSSGKCSRGYWDRKFLVECSVCHKDVELWGETKLTLYKEDLQGDVINCGCKGRCKWKRHQQEVRVKRICDSKGFVYLGLIGTYKGNKTKIKILNPLTGNIWGTTNINTATGKSDWGDPITREYRISAKTRYPESRHIEDIYIKGGFSRDKFTFSFYEKRGRRDFYKVICKVCKDDMYVKEGVSNPYFITDVSSLKAGNVPCRCGNNPRWTSEERTLYSKNLCSERGISFVGWEEGTYKNKDSKILWLCQKGHLTSSNFNDFRNGSGCPECALGLRKGWGNGYMPNKVEEDDYLYVIKFKGEYLKCGRALIIENRIIHSGNGLLKESGCTRDQLEILHVYTGTHQEVYDTEQFVIDELTERGFYYKTWTRETFSLDSEKLMVNLIENHSTLTKVEYVEGM